MTPTKLGDYRVERELGRGGMGVVYLAATSGGERVAIKALLGHGLGSAEDRLRFEREAQALRTLDHEGILGVRAHGLEGNVPYIVMDYLDGPTLEEQLKTSGALREQEVIELGRGMAEALAHAHSRGILHRDLKPANVVLQGGRPLLVDFGLVRILGDDLARSRLTETGTILGSPCYMAPEQAQGSTDVGPAADVYGLGATLYALACGRPPHLRQSSVVATLQAILTEDPPPPRALRPELSPELEAVILRCLERDPARRHASSFALASALGELSAPNRPRAKPTGRIALALVLALGAGAVWAATEYAAPPPPGADPEDWTVDPSNAQAVLRRAEERLRVEPEDLPAHLALAEAYACLDDHHPALSESRWILEREPLHVRALLVAGSSSRALGELEGSKAFCDRGLALAPDNVNLWTLSSLLASMQGDLSACERAAERAVELDPRDPGALAALGSSHAQLGRPQEALECYTRALERSDHPLTRFNRGAVLLTLGRNVDALADFEACLARKPDDVSAQCLRVRALGRHDPPAALEPAEALALRHPDDPQVQIALAEACLNLRRTDDARRALQRCVELDPQGILGDSARRKLRKLDR